MYFKCDFGEVVKEDYLMPIYYFGNHKNITHFFINFYNRENEEILLLKVNLAWLTYVVD